MLNTNVLFGKGHTESVFINKVIFSENSVRCFGLIRKQHESNIKLIRNINVNKSNFENSCIRIHMTTRSLFAFLIYENHGRKKLRVS